MTQRTITHFVLFLVSILFHTVAGFSQDTITGLISGADGLALPGATIVNKSSNLSSSADASGRYSIGGKQGDLLVFSFIGFQTQEKIVGSSAMIDITLEESSTLLDSIVVTGYMSQHIKEITGSVAIVDPEELISIPAGQAEQMLQGRVAGLNVITSGAPGSPANVRIHGIGNFGDVTPLYIIDGVQGDINNLNPADIESMQVLKDAGSYAIYGVRGANGVIVITTRNGKKGRAKVSYDFYGGVTVPLKDGPEILTPQEVAEVRWLAERNSGTPVYQLYGSGPDPVLPDYFISGRNDPYFTGDPAIAPEFYNANTFQIIEANKAGTDWFHEVFNPAFSQNHSLNVSGANDKNQYMLSLGYLDQQGTALHTYLKRYTARVNTAFSVHKNIRIGENIQLSYRDNLGIDRRAFDFNELTQSIIASPIMPIYDIAGGWAHMFPVYFDENPVAMREIAKDDKSTSLEVFGNVYMEADLFNSLTFRTSFGGNQNNYHWYNFRFITYDSLAQGVPNNEFREVSGYRRSLTWTNTLIFSKTFESKHNVKALVGFETINNYAREVGGSKIGLITNDPNLRFLSNGIQQGQSNYSQATTSTLTSFIGQATYSYREKYFLSGTLRRDGSSIFGPDNRFGWFPSVGAAWRITEEFFMYQQNWLTDFKLRASWGKTGFFSNTDPLNQYTYYDGSPSYSYYDIHGTSKETVQGFKTVHLGEPATGWQEDIVTNIGFETVLWNGKLAIAADWYIKKAKGLLFPVTLPDILGNVAAPYVNVGEVENKGLDILLSSNGAFSRNLKWNISMTFTTYNNEIVNVNNVPHFSPSYYFQGQYYLNNLTGLVRNEVGHPTSSFYGHKIVGLFESEADVANSPTQEAAAPGRFKYLDANGDSSITADDRVFFGDANPTFTTGINLSVTYKNFDLSTFFYGSFGNDVYNATKHMTDRYPAISRRALYDSWSPENPHANVPKPEASHNFSNWAAVNSYGLEDGSYFRNKSLILGYSFAQNRLDKMKMSKLRIYIQAVNLFTITRYSGLDPELAGESAVFGVDIGNYPNNQQQFLLGINLGF